MTTTVSKKALKGLGQLEAYTDVDEGVAFQMDNELIWDSSGSTSDWAIRGVSKKKESSKLFINQLPSGKVTMTDWNERHLAPIPPEGHPDIYPLRPDPNYTPKDEVLQFDVFYIGNKVAFQAHNGLFLTRVYRDYHTIEAAKAVDDESCYFRPMIGDLHIPKFEIVHVDTYHLPEIKYFYTVLQTDMFENNSNLTVSHTFNMSWQTTVTDRIAWKYLWGRGVATSHEMEINGTKITLKYTEDNERTVYVKRNINVERRREVVVPPKSKCIARLVVFKNDIASFSFMAVIHKEKPNGTVFKLLQPGAWIGSLYNDIYVEINILQNCYPCNIQ